jgi:hypothetical protein
VTLLRDPSGEGKFVYHIFGQQTRSFELDVDLPSGHVIWRQGGDWVVWNHPSGVPGLVDAPHVWDGDEYVPLLYNGTAFVLLSGRPPTEPAPGPVDSVDAEPDPEPVDAEPVDADSDPVDASSPPPEGGVTLIDDEPHRWGGEEWVPIGWGDLTMAEWKTLADDFGGFTSTMSRRGVEWYETSYGIFYQIGDHRSPVYYPPKADGAEGVIGGRQWVIADGRPVPKHDPPEFVDGVKHVWDGEQWVPHLHTDDGWVPAQWDDDQLVPAGDPLDDDTPAAGDEPEVAEVEVDPANIDTGDPGLDVDLGATADDPRRPGDPSFELNLNRIEGRPQPDPISLDVPGLAGVRDTGSDGPLATVDSRPTFGAGDHRLPAEDAAPVEAPTPTASLDAVGVRPTLDDGGLRSEVREDLTLAPEVAAVPAPVADGGLGSRLGDDTTERGSEIAGRWAGPADEQGDGESSDDGLLDA